MEIHSLRISQGPTVKFKGELIVSHEEQANTIDRGGAISRRVRTFEVYQRQDESYLLYTQETYVGSSDSKREIRDFPSLHALYLALLNSCDSNNASVADALVDKLLTETVG